MNSKPRIHQLLANPVDGPAIEALSFTAIDGEAPAHEFTSEQWPVVRRMIHTTADFGLMAAVRFSNDAVAAGCRALGEGRPIYVDAHMIRSGISTVRLRAVCPRYDRQHIHCHVADPDVAATASASGLPRAVAAIRKARAILDGAIVAVGNSPTALLELNRMVIEEGIRPALVVAVPVGFVHVVESKEELMGLDVPQIVVAGRRGGSPLAVSVIHALCALAEGVRPAAEDRDGAVDDFDAVILLGHGSRVPDAGQSMQRLAASLKDGGRYPVVACCNMSRLGPHFEETFEALVQQGARQVLVLPYFLHDGLHIRLDIPAMMQAAAAQHPHVGLVFGPNLGFDPLLVELVERRIAQSRGFPDVRRLMLPGETDYPVPPGQCEFVPMPPEEAAKWRKGQC